MSNNALYRMKRSVKIGTVSFVICLLLAALLIAANLLAGLLPAKLSRFDVSGTGLTSVTDQTKTFLKGMTEDVTVYWVIEGGVEDGQLGLFLSRYAETGKHVTVKTVDPTVDTEFLSKYGATSLASGSFVVESAKRYTTVDIRQMYMYTNPLFQYLEFYESGISQTPLSYDQINSIYEQYGSIIQQFVLMYEKANITQSDILSYQQAVSFCGESRMTAAIDYVTREYIPHAYLLTGYGDAKLTASMTEYLEMLDTDELSLKDTQSIPADAGCLILYSPTVDMTAAEADLVKAYLNGGGTLILNTSPEAVETCPRIMNLGAEFGLIPQPGEIEEGNTAAFKGNPNLLLPTVSGMSASTNGTVTAYMPNSHAIAITTVAGVKTEALMTTTETAQRISLADKTTALGEKGKMNVAVKAEKTVTGADGKATTAHVVWFGSANAFTELAEQVNSGWNNQFHAYQTVYTQDSFVSSYVSIESTPLTQSVLENITLGWALALGAILTLVIPCALLITGIVIWALRRRR